MAYSSKSKTKTVTAADAKARLSELLARVAYGGDKYVIERRGKPIAALVSVDDLERIGRASGEAEDTPRGLLALVGMWEGIMTDEEVDEFLDHVYAARDRDLGRPVSLED